MCSHVNLSTGLGTLGDLLRGVSSVRVALPTSRSSWSVCVKGSWFVVHEGKIMDKTKWTLESCFVAKVNNSC